MTGPSITGRPTDAVKAVLGTGPDLSGPTAPNGAADFLAAILQALTSAVSPSASAEPAADPAEDDTAGSSTQDAGVLGLTGVPVVPPIAVGAVAGGVQPAPGHANVAGVTGGTPTSPGSDIRMSGDAAGTPPAGASTTGATPAAADSAVPGAGAAADASTTSGRMPEAPAHGAVSAEKSGDAAGASEGQSPQVAGVDAGRTVPVGAGSAPTTHGAQPTAATSPSAHVTRQVFPEVTSLTTRGDGTHRIILALEPESLGEVRVVMTVREGVVHVRLAAGHEAQRALIEGSPELTRLLEAAGATDTRVVVRDLGASTSSGTGTGPSQGTPDQQTPDQQTQDQQTQDQQTRDQHAGTRAHHPATDGTNHTRTIRGTTGADQPRSVEPVTRTRTAGVDVTM